ncbi:MAG: DUF1653 domain-containing protein [Parachlamydia sp.]|jgi:hypothetical protein|nr:DUF1653 domain-containing protein [Parachlamydia sp.]
MNPKPLPPLSSLANTLVVNGIYEHYKGFRYQCLAVARHSETLEELVVYQALYGKQGIWVRPLTMFLETVVFDDKMVPRFRLVD